MITNIWDIEGTERCESREIDDEYETQLLHGDSIPEHAVSRCENDATGQYHVNGAFGDSGIYWLCDDCVTDTTDDLIEPVDDQQ